MAFDFENRGSDQVDDGEGRIRDPGFREFTINVRAQASLTIGIVAHSEEEAIEILKKRIRNKEVSLPLIKWEYYSF